MSDRAERIQRIVDAWLSRTTPEGGFEASAEEVLEAKSLIVSMIDTEGPLRDKQIRFFEIIAPYIRVGSGETIAQLIQRLPTEVLDEINKALSDDEPPFDETL